MLTISGITALAEKAKHSIADIDYSRKSRQRHSTVFRFHDENYAAHKIWLQQRHLAYRDSSTSTLLGDGDDDDVEWLPIERAGAPSPSPTFFEDSIFNAARYTFKPGRYSGHLFVSALSCIAQHPGLLKRIIPGRTEQNCFDVYVPVKKEEVKDELDDIEIGSTDDTLSELTDFTSDLADAKQPYVDEYGQMVSYFDDRESARSEEEYAQYYEEPPSYGLFKSSYQQHSGGRRKLGIWDSDEYSSSENEEGIVEYLQQPQPFFYEGAHDYQVEEPSGKYPAEPPIPDLPQIANRYAGIFRFRLWRRGRWVEICVDELLPYSGLTGEPLSLSAVNSNEEPLRDIWPALLEKAHAKMLGRYRGLSSSGSGCIEDFLSDLSGGICETIHLRTSQHRSDFGLQASLGHRMHTELYNGRRLKMTGGKIPGLFSLLIAIDEPHNPKQEGQDNSHGLIYGRAYPITDVKEVSFGEVEAFAPNSHSLLMVRLRDPFGPSEWNGPFSQGSPEWLAIAPAERQRIGLVCESDSEFWMPIDTFCERFSQLTFCRIINTAKLTLRQSFCDDVREGSWRQAVRMAGGSFENNRETFLRNPQFVFRVEPHHTTVMIGLSQLLTREDASAERHSIGFTVLHVEENRIYRVHHIPTPEAGFSPIITTTHYRHTGPVFAKLLLYHGRYVIVPTTNEPNKNGNFLLRLVSAHQSYLRSLCQDIPARRLLMPYPMCVTRIRVLRASSLQRLDRPTGPISAYCKVWCERHWVRTKTIWNNTDPEWNQSAVFYRRWSATHCMKVVIWHHAPGYYPDQYLGKHIFQAYEETGRPITVSLYGRRRWENNQPRSGVLTVEITSSADLGAL